MYYLYLFLGIILSLVTVTLKTFSLWLFVPFTFLYWLALIISHILVACIVAVFVKKDEEDITISNSMYMWVACVLRLFCDTIMIKLHTEGLEKLPEHNKFLLVSNHISFLDPVLGLICFKKYKLSYIAKKEIFKAPLINNYMKKLNFLGLDRENPRNAIKTINKAAEIIERGEQAVAIFPEGTRNKNPEKLLEFKNGAFKAAMKAKSGIAVTVIKNADQYLKGFPFKRTHVLIKVIDYISAEEVEKMSSNEIAEKVHNMISENL